MPDKISTHQFAGALALLCAWLTLACEDPSPAPVPSASAAGRKTPDRLAPGELAETELHLFGLKLPKGMKLEARFTDSAYAVGDVTAEQLSNYVKERVHVGHVELAGKNTVFPKARIKGSDPKHLYRIEVTPRGRRSKLTVELLNPPRPPAEKGLSEAERWRRAGLSPDGKQLNPDQLE